MTSSNVKRKELLTLCVQIKNELRGLNKLTCELALKKGQHKEIILTFGQQAVTDAPEEMKNLLTKQTYRELVSMYQKLK